MYWYIYSMTKGNQVIYFVETNILFKIFKLTLQIYNTWIAIFLL